MNNCPHDSSGECSVSHEWSGKIFKPVGIKHEDSKLSGRFNANEEKKNEQLEHSKLVREIEKKLNLMMINFNIGIIIQMTLEQKMSLYNKIK